MPFSIELHFDEKNDLVLRNLWKKLKDSGISDYMYEYGGYPHIALLVFDEMDVHEAKGQLRKFSEDINKFILNMSSLGVFPFDDGVLFAAPTVDNLFINFHRKIYELFKENSSIWEYYKPGSWVPHCTLGLNIPKSMLHEALRVVLEDFEPLTLEVMSLKLVEFNPVKIIDSYELR